MMHFPDYPKAQDHPYYEALWERLVYEMGRIPRAEDMTILNVRHKYARTAIDRIEALAAPEHMKLISEWLDALHFVTFQRRIELRKGGEL